MGVTKLFRKLLEFAAVRFFPYITSKQLKLHILTFTATNSKSKNIRDLYREIKELKRGHQPRSNLVKENGDLLTDVHNILNRWKNYFSVIECTYSQCC
jgi:hypothetical protein